MLWNLELFFYMSNKKLHWLFFNKRPFCLSLGFVLFFCFSLSYDNYWILWSFEYLSNKQIAIFCVDIYFAFHSLYVCLHYISFNCCTKLGHYWNMRTFEMVLITSNSCLRVKTCFKVQIRAKYLGQLPILSISPGICSFRRIEGMTQFLVRLRGRATWPLKHRSRRAFHSHIHWHDGGA